MRQYVGPIGQGVVVFAVVALALWLPYTIWQYRWRYLLRESVLLWPIGVVPGLGARVDAALPDHPLWMLAVVFGLPVAWLGVLGLVSLLRADRRSLPDLIAGTRVVMR